MKLVDNGIRTLEAESEADFLIVETAVEISETTAAGVVVEDVDFIVMAKDG